MDSGDVSFFGRAGEQAVGDSRGDKDTGVGTADDTHQHSEDEALDILTAEEAHDEDDEQHHDSGTAGVDVTAEGAVHCIVEVGSVASLRGKGQVLTYTVVDNHHVVDRVTDHRQDSGDELLVDFERQHIAEEGEHTDGDQGIVAEHEDTTETELPVAESDGDVDKDKYERDEHGDDSLENQLVSHSGLHTGGTQDSDIVFVNLLETIFGDIGLIDAFQGFVEFILALSFNICGGVIDLIVDQHAQAVS